MIPSDVDLKIGRTALALEILDAPPAGRFTAEKRQVKGHPRPLVEAEASSWILCPTDACRSNPASAAPFARRRPSETFPPKRISARHWKARQSDEPKPLGFNPSGKGFTAEARRIVFPRRAAISARGGGTAAASR
jgi:hypothetical protein